ncbi:MAG: YraN family protein [Thermomicrobiales bacterium]|nr:YraN family protein [Thermomicrobiales bacterium]
MRTARQALGDAGERLARQQLESRGYSCLAEQWRCPHGELDLVMRQGEHLVFVEVKVRRGGLVEAEQAVTPAQQRRLLATAQTFLDDHPDLQDLTWRVDLFGITLDRSGRITRISHLENAIST